MKHAIFSIARLTLPLGAAACLLGGCSTIGYYWQSVSGHLQILSRTQSVQHWLGDAQTPEHLKAKLALSQRIRSFAVTDLKLPDNASYHRYADLQRNAVVWNVMATPQLSLTLETYCFPIAGCVAYRGYFNEADARIEAERLQAKGLDVSVFGISAYSTLGWMNWAGGDPLLTLFSESFASTVERLGSHHWLQTQADDGARLEYAMLEKWHQDFRALTLATRLELQAIYQEDQKEAGKMSVSPLNTTAQLEAKARALQRFHDHYAKLKAAWNGFTGYDTWIAHANNASFAAQATYDALVPNFEALFEREGRDWQRLTHARPCRR